MIQILREPLLHFLVLGTLIFGAFAAFDDSPRPVAATRLVVSDADAGRLVRQFEATWRRPPTATELDALIDEYVREEIYVREALALGLDRDDAVVRRRLQQKMEFLTETGAGMVAPSEAQLQNHLDRHPDRFVRPALVAFEQVTLPEGSGAGEADTILAALAAGDDPASLGQASLLPRQMRPSPPVAVDGTFGKGFFDRLAATEPGRWTGPLRSAYGAHAVRVLSYTPERLPPLAEIRDAVERDWRAEQSSRLRAERYEALRARYTVERPDAAEILAR
jgi:hypothetical protein